MTEIRSLPKARGAFGSGEPAAAVEYLAEVLPLGFAASSFVRQSGRLVAFQDERAVRPF